MIERELKHEGGSQVLIAYIIFVVLVLTLIVVPLTAYQEFLDNSDFFNFGKCANSFKIRKLSSLTLLNRAVVTPRQIASKFQGES